MQFPNMPDNDDKSKKQGGGDGPPQMQPPRWLWPLIMVIALAWIVIVSGSPIVGELTGANPLEISYSFFYEQVENCHVSQVILRGDEVRGRFTEPVTYPSSDPIRNACPAAETDSSTADQGGAGTSGGQSADEGSSNIQPRTSTRFTTTLPSVGDPDLLATLREAGVSIRNESVDPGLLPLLLNFLLPFALIIGFVIWTARRVQRQTTGIFGFGRSQAKQYDAEKPAVTFADVAGQDAAKNELYEIVDFLREPDKYIALGARIPRGVLLVGPPGTGKTLMARAVAGEAGVAFYSIAASEFVEMFVGVGASRVRDLFNKAKANSPAIVFIDEIDAVGRQRGAGLGGGNDEREQTLNQLLNEMDGFDQTESLIIMAATNRPDVLDPALLRPGRFDRQVTVGPPDRKGRLDILKIHTRGKPLEPGVDLQQLARATIGFSGADLANLANEAALTAARGNHKKISMRDFLDALDRIILGTERPPLSNPRERKVVAYHEAGHALVGTLVPEGDPVLKVTIVPRGMAGGVTATMPDDDRMLVSREYIMARLRMVMGGRAAEEVAIGQITTGAENDLRQATQLARRMVAQWGMSDRIGTLNFGDDDRQPFLGYALSQGRSYSEQTAAAIDEEVRSIVDDAHKDALKLLRENRGKLDALAEALLEHEVIDRPLMLEILGMTEQANEEDESPESAVPTEK